mmetsp:Transcript_26224/g.59751  ORF Transcript_26224/g.59751 Transcript_26224/m.59751 type:complete len:206 (-) Transcript_26224:25-642(-)
MFSCASSMPPCDLRIRFFSDANLEPRRLKSALIMLLVLVFFSRSSLHCTIATSSCVTCPSIILLITIRACCNSASDRDSGPSPLWRLNAVSNRGEIPSPIPLIIVSSPIGWTLSNSDHNFCHEYPDNAFSATAWAASESSICSCTRNPAELTQAMRHVSMTANWVMLLRLWRSGAAQVADRGLDTVQMAQRTARSWSAVFWHRRY